MRARPTPGSNSVPQPRLGYFLGIFPRLSQTFVLEEILALRRIGCTVTVFSMAAPTATDLALVPGAAGIHCLYLERFRAIALARATIRILARSPWRLLRTALVVLYQRDRALWRTFGAALLAVREIDRLRLDHLHAHLRSGSDCLWLVGQLTGRPWTFTAHARDIYVWNRYLDRKLAAAARVITVCDFNRALLAARLDADGLDKIHVIRPFLAPELLATQPISPPLGDPFRLVSVCRLEPKKGLDLLLEAMALLRDRHLPITLTIVGDGSQWSLLFDLVRRLSLEALVTFAGRCNAAQVRAVLSAAHCAVLPARRAPDGDSDATPMVLGEAMALGLPVISTRLSGIPEIVPPGAGLLVEPEEPLALANAVAEIAAMPSQHRLDMGRIGRRFVMEHWNGDRDIHCLVRVFRSPDSFALTPPCSGATNSDAANARDDDPGWPT